MVGNGYKTDRCSQHISVVRLKGGRNLSTVVIHKKLGYFHAVIVNCSFTTSYLYLNCFFQGGKL